MTISYFAKSVHLNGMEEKLVKFPSLVIQCNDLLQCTVLPFPRIFVNVIKILRLCDIVSLTIMHFEHIINSVKY